jgi:hypothetical protein
MFCLFFSSFVFDALTKPYRRTISSTKSSGNRAGFFLHFCEISIGRKDDVIYQLARKIPVFLVFLVRPALYLFNRSRNRAFCLPQYSAISPSSTLQFRLPQCPKSSTHHVSKSFMYNIHSYVFLYTQTHTYI